VKRRRGVKLEKHTTQNEWEAAKFSSGREWWLESWPEAERRTERDNMQLWRHTMSGVVRSVEDRTNINKIPNRMPWKSPRFPRALRINK